jgi:hypothetical protein
MGGAVTNQRWWDRAELLAADLAWLVRLEWAERVVYLSPQQETAADPETGETVTWQPGVDDFTWSESLDLFSLSPAVRSLTLTIRPHWLDVPQLIADRRDLHQCTVQIYRHIRGGRSLLYFSGRVREYAFGPKGMPVELAIDANPWDDSGELCPETARVDSVTWPNAAEKTNGEMYPIVIGQPGLISEGTSVQAVPAFAVDPSEKYLLIAGHAVKASQVTVHQNGTSATGPVEHVADGRGRLVAVADVHNHFSGITYQAGDTYRTSWTEGPGLVQEGGVAIRTAGQVLRWAVRQSTAPWDMVSVKVASRLLESYQIDTSIVCDPAEHLRPWDWLASQLLPLLPVSIHGTARGLGIHVWPLGESPVANLTRGRQGVFRAGRVQSEDRTRLLTESAIRYAYDADHNLYSERVAAVSRSEDEANGGGVHRALQAGRMRYGVGVVEAQTSDLIYSAATAGAVVGWRAQELGLPAFFASYDLEQQWGWLRLGDQVTITDSEVGWANRLAVIQGVEHSLGGRMTVALRVRDTV